MPTQAAWVKVDSNAFNGVVGTGYAAISCGDFDALTRQLDCAVGEAAGDLYVYKDRSDSSATEDYSFDMDTSFLKSVANSRIVPFCLDFEASATFSCLFGLTNGTVLFSANSGGEGSFTTPYLGSARVKIETLMEYAAPFCADFDNDGDIDCIIGWDNGTDTGVQ